MKRLLSIPAFALAVLCSATTPSPAEAGVIVLKNGEVIVGRLRVEEVTEESMIVRWPYGAVLDKGKAEIPRGRIRWYDLNADAPSSAYWEQYGLDHEIDSKYHPLYEKWKNAQKARDEDEGLIYVPFQPTLTSSKLDLIPTTTKWFEIRKPTDWTPLSDKDGITIFQSNEIGPDDFRARIHVYSVPSLKKTSAAQQMKLIEKQLGRVAGPTGKFKMLEKDVLKTIRGVGDFAADQEFVTATTRGGVTVRALRRVSFRSKRTYFFVAYAHDQEYAGLKGLFKDCLGTLKLLEDEQARSKKGEAEGEGESESTSDK